MGFELPSGPLPLIILNKTLQTLYWEDFNCTIQHCQQLIPLLRVNSRLRSLHLVFVSACSDSLSDEATLLFDLTETLRYHNFTLTSLHICTRNFQIDSDCFPSKPYDRTDEEILLDNLPEFRQSVHECNIYLKLNSIGRNKVKMSQACPVAFVECVCACSHSMDMIFFLCRDFPTVFSHFISN